MARVLFVVFAAVSLLLAATAVLAKQNDSQGWPGELDVIGGSQNSVPLLKAYGANSLQEVVGDALENVKVRERKYALSPCEDGKDQQLNANPSCGGLLEARGFKLEVSGAGADDVDNAWETIEGGSIVVDVLEKTIAEEKPDLVTPGQRAVNAIDLRGPLATNLKAFADLFDNETGACEKCGTAVLSFYDAKNHSIASFNFTVFDAFYFKNEAFLLVVEDDALRWTVVSVNASVPGSAFPNPPKIFMVLPPSGSVLMPVAIAGTGFGEGAVPYFNGVPATPLFGFNTQNFPLLGKLTVAVTIVPILPPGPAVIVVEYLGQKSNAFPFTVQ